MLLKSTVLLLLLTVHARRPKHCLESSYRAGCKVNERPKKSGTLDSGGLGIIGGVKSTYDKFPYVVALMYRKMNNSVPNGSYFKCGASVLNSRLVLTAAHCFPQKAKANRYYVIGGHEEYRKGKYKSDVQKFIVNENYNPETFINDIALAYLTETLPTSIRRVKISRFFRQNEINMAKVCGWGATKLDHTELSHVLKCIESEIFSDRDCKFILGIYYHPSLICAGKPKANVQIDAASVGDSGGPIMFGNHQIAMVCAGPADPLDPDTSEFYNMYTLISYHHDWIMETKKQFL